ncbi:MAG: hypothetical protein Q9197_003629 [Variospora fuerteventurae]
MPATQQLFPPCTSTHTSIFLTVVCLLGILFTTTCLFSYHRRPHTYAHKLGLRSPDAPSTAPHPPPPSTTVHGTHAATSPTRDGPIDAFSHLTSSTSPTTDPPSTPPPPPGSTILSASRETAFALSLLLLLYFGEYRALTVVISTVTTVVGLGDSAAMAWYGGSGWKRGAGPMWSAVVLGAWFLGRWACVV